MKKKLIMSVLVLSGLFLGGCAKAPQAEIDATVALIEEVKLSEADVYMPVEFAALQDSMAVITTEVEVQKSKFFGKYKGVKQKLVVLNSLLDELKSSTLAKKVQIKEEVVAILGQLQTLNLENRSLLEKAPKGKEGKLAISAIQAELDVIEATTAEVAPLLESGKLLDAQSKAKAAQTSALAINTELTTVIEKYTKKTK